MEKCTAVVDGGNINFVIEKSDKGYETFATILERIHKQGCMTWYGDIIDENGDEQSGLIIRSK